MRNCLGVPHIQGRRGKEQSLVDSRRISDGGTEGEGLNLRDIQTTPAGGGGVQIYEGPGVKGCKQMKEGEGKKGLEKEES